MAKKEVDSAGIMVPPKPDSLLRAHSELPVVGATGSGWSRGL